MKSLDLFKNIIISVASGKFNSIHISGLVEISQNKHSITFRYVCIQVRYHAFHDSVRNKKKRKSRSCPIIAGSVGLYQEAQ